MPVSLDIIFFWVIFSNFNLFMGKAGIHKRGWGWDEKNLFQHFVISLVEVPSFSFVLRSN